jgi:enoyl-CoA hydratase/carnithine racemase
MLSGGSAMAAQILLVESRNGIVTLTLNQPERRNPLSSAMMETLLASLQELAKDSSSRVVIIASNGPAFCSGHDLAELRGRDMDFYRAIFDLCTRLMTTIQSIPQPVIAQVGGIATAAGCQLVATCDLAIAAQSATFATPGVKIGLFCSTPMVALSRAIGRKHAMEMLLSGRPVDAPTAERWGLVNRVVPDDQLAAATRALALQIADASPLTVATGKRAFYSQIDLDQAAAYEHTREVMSRNAMAADAQEGIGAFLEKRQPRWCGR